MSTPPPGPYVLGHTDYELARLERQAQFMDPMTRRFFAEAGVSRGMRVLDIGSGVGDVAFLAAELVGPTGRVIGADRSSSALATARTRAQQRGLANVSFREGDPSTMTFDEPFDAVVGRFVLMFQPDPIAMLKKLKTHVRPGGIIVFHESDWANVRSFPTVATYEKCCAWIVEAFIKGGAEVRMGIKLHAAFTAAGLPSPTMRQESIIAGAGNAEQEVRLKTELVRTLAQDIERFGIATADEIGIETLAERVLEEMASKNAVIVHHADVAAWCRV